MSTRSPSRTPAPGDPETLVLPNGPITGETTELLQEFVHPSHHPEDTLVDESADNDNELEQRSSLPWYRRPSYLWILCGMPLSTIAVAATIAPKVEIYTQLVCLIHKPDIFHKPTHTPFPPVGHLPVILLIEGTNACAKDPVVSAEVAKLAAVMTTTMGVLTCLTTAWWGSFSDRHGRRTVLALSIAGLLIAELNFIFVCYFYDRLPGGYWFLIVGFILEGLLGGLTAGAAAVQGYIADTTTPGTRSRIFSLMAGLFFVGFAFGPTVGGILIRLTHNTLSVFYFAAVAHFLFILLTLVIIPESLTQKQMHRSTMQYNTELAETARSRGAAGLLFWSKRLFMFLTPLNIFLPSNIHTLKKLSRDWNLTLIVLAYGFTITIMGSYTFKFQYAALTFGWDSQIMGYWLTVIGIARAVHLTMILPLVLKFFTYFKRPRLSLSEEEPLIASSSSSPSTASPKNHHSPRFDLNVARVSLLIEVVAYMLMALATRPLAFTGAAVLGAMGGGFNPAIQAVALDLYSRRKGAESGKLFGALSVVQALSGQIIGPAMYGLIYMKTVAVVPRALFFVSMASVSISFILLLIVKIPKRGPTIIVSSPS